MCICHVYEESGLESPREIVWVGSPPAAARVLEGLEEQQQLIQSLTHIDGEFARKRLIDSVLAQIRRRVMKDFGLTAWLQVYGSVRQRTTRALADGLRWEMGDHLGLFAFGQNDGDWLAAYSFLAEECGYQPAEALRPLMNLVRHCGWWVPLNGAAIACERPTRAVICDGLLHKAPGPALVYRDGFQLWVERGCRIAQGTGLRDRLWEGAEHLAVQRIVDSRNGDERLFVGPHVTVLDRESVDIGGVQQPYALVLAWHRRGGRHQALMMVNPSTGEHHMEWVPSEVRTVRGALEWRNGASEPPRVIT